MLDRREFLGSITLPAALAAAGGMTFTRELLASPSAQSRGLPVQELEELSRSPGTPEEIARDEDFWSVVQQAFTADRSITNLNNGGVSPSPRIVQEAMKRHLDYSNTATAYTLWRVLEPQREPIRHRMAREWGVDGEEIAFTRNSSESLQICQQGFDLKAGDEVLTTTQDYPRMITTFRQMERRIGIRLVQFKIPVPCEDPTAIVSKFEEAITPRTRLILVSHMINITGQILPIRAVVEMARKRTDALPGGIPVIVDGAHALAHFSFSLADLNCDYYGVSLHKWLHAPHGTGLLYVRKEKITGLWPMMAADQKQDSDIRKFEEIGTHPAANALAIADALTFHQMIGGERKEARLRYLRDRWAKRLMQTCKGRVRLHTSLDPRFSCGIGTLEIEGIDNEKVLNHLWDKHRILAVYINHDEFKGIRITPSTYSTLEEIDRFCEVIEQVVRQGIPG